MKERLINKAVVAGLAVVSAIGANACGGASSQSAETAPRFSGALERACYGGLPPFRQTKDGSYVFRVPIPCKVSPVGVYDKSDPMQAKPVGKLRAGQPFQIVCQNSGDKPPSVLVRGQHPAFEGLVNLSAAAATELGQAGVCMASSADEEKILHAQLT